MKSLMLCITFIVLHFIHTITFSQTPSLDSDPPPSWVVFSTVNSKIPGNRVTAIAQDANELLYFAIGGKVYAYNGVDWKNLLKPGSWSSSDDIIRIIPDPLNFIWVINSKNQLACLEEGEWTEPLKMNPEMRNVKVTGMVVDKNNTRWFTTLGKGLLKYDGAEFIKTDTLADVPDTAFYGVAMDDKGIFWILASTGLIKFSGDSVFTAVPAFSYPVAPEMVKSFLAVSDSRLWLAGGSPLSSRTGGIATFDGMTTFLYNHLNASLTSPNVTTAALDQTGRLWIGTGNCRTRDFKTETDIFYNGGIARLSDQRASGINASFLKFLDTVPYKLNTTKGLYSDEENKNRAQNVNVLFIDKDNNKWIGTDNGLFVNNEKGIKIE